MLVHNMFSNQFVYFVTLQKNDTVLSVFKTLPKRTELSAKNSQQT